MILRKCKCCDISLTVEFSRWFIQQRSAIKIAKKDFSLEEAVNCWHKQRKFKFRTVQKNILIREDEEIYSGLFYEFAPLWNTEAKEQELLKSGFYAVPLGYNLDWRQNQFYEKVFDDFFHQFVIDGDNPHGYYIVGSIGVGKTTLLASIAKILKTFLLVEVKYITMTRLVRLITSINSEDKKQIAKLENCPVLFIDDLGIEKYATDTQEAFVRDFFAYRYGNGLINIIAGNTDIRKHQNSNSFFRQMSDYINDTKQYKIIEMMGKSKRMQQNIAKKRPKHLKNIHFLNICGLVWFSVVQKRLIQFNWVQYGLEMFSERFSKVQYGLEKV